MNIVGKLIGAAFGFMVFGPFGAVLGALIGHGFDRGRGGLGADMSSASAAVVKQEFFTATFSVMGRLAKADGQVSSEEIKVAEQVMARMSLSDDQRRRARELFNQGKQPDFDYIAVLKRFRARCGTGGQLLRVFVEIQLEAAMADGLVHAAEKQLLVDMGRVFGFSPAEMAQIEALAGGGSYRRAGAGSAAASRDELAHAYQVLGVSRDADDATVKKAYRRLLNQHHPDKLAARGLPDEMANVAKEKTIEIRQAWELIREARGIRP